MPGEGIGEQLLNDIESELGGFGEETIRQLDQVFDTEDEFLSACHDAYQNRDTERLEQVPLIGPGYALKLARWMASREGWTSGDAEPQEVSVFGLNTIGEGR